MPRDSSGRNSEMNKSPKVKSNDLCVLGEHILFTRRVKTAEDI